MTITAAGGARAGGPGHVEYGAPDAPMAGYGRAASARIARGHAARGGVADARDAYSPQGFGAEGLSDGAPAHGDPAYQTYATGAARPVWPAILHGAGALASLALVAGVTLWGYGHVKRDVSGVPVVRALEGPMRVAPEQPGGQIADHVGLAVNAVKAGGAAEPLPETLVLAPEDDALAPEDRPVPELAPAPGAAETAGAGAPAAGGAPLEAANPPLPLVEARLQAPASAAGPGLAAADPGEAEAADAAAAPSSGAAPDPKDAVQPHAAAIAEALAAAGLEPGREEAPGVETEAEAAAAAVEESAPTSAPAPAPATVQRPAPRPATRLDTAATSASFLRLGEDDAELPTVPPGTRLVQLGAYDSIAQARAGWAEFSNRFGPLMAGKSRVLQQAEAGGNTFWRLRAAGFDDLAHARRFCAALVAERADCIPVVAR